MGVAPSSLYMGPWGAMGGLFMPSFVSQRVPNVLPLHLQSCFFNMVFKNMVFKNMVFLEKYKKKYFKNSSQN